MTNVPNVQRSAPGGLFVGAADRLGKPYQEPILHQPVRERNYRTAQYQTDAKTRNHSSSPRSVRFTKVRPMVGVTAKDRIHHAAHEPVFPPGPYHFVDRDYFFIAARTGHLKASSTVGLPLSCSPQAMQRGILLASSSAFR